MAPRARNKKNTTSKLVSLDELIRREELFTPERVAELAGYNAAYLREKCRLGLVDVQKRGQRYFFTKDQLTKLMPQPIIVDKGARE